MIELLATTGVSESTNNPGWFLVHSIGVGMGILGLIFFLGTAVGMVRFPDFYTRMHAAGKGDTLSTMLMLAGFGLVMMEDFSVNSWLLLLKILGIVLFIFITTPTINTLKNCRLQRSPQKQPSHAPRGTGPQPPRAGSKSKY